MLDETHLHRGMLWRWELRDGRLWSREAGGEWHDVGTKKDLEALHKFYGAPWPIPGPRWMPWHPIRDWFLRRRAKRVYAKWFNAKHKAELQHKKEKRLAELNRLFVRKTP